MPLKDWTEFSVANDNADRFRRSQDLLNETGPVKHYDTFARIAMKKIGESRGGLKVMYVYRHKFKQRLDGQEETEDVDWDSNDEVKKFGRLVVLSARKRKGSETYCVCVGCGSAIRATDTAMDRFSESVIDLVDSFRAEVAPGHETYVLEAKANTGSDPNYRWADHVRAYAQGKVRLHRLSKDDPEANRWPRSKIWQVI